MNYSRNEVLDGISSALWCSAWADAMEEAGHRFGAGEDVCDSAGEPPAWVRKHAEGVLKQYKKANPEDDIKDIYEEALDSKYDAPEDCEEFGFQLGMLWLGHGIGYADAVADLVAPHGEFSLEIDDAEAAEHDPTVAELVYSSALRG